MYAKLLRCGSVWCTCSLCNSGSAPSYLLFIINVTISTGLIAQTADLVFHQELKATWINYQITPSKSARLEWSTIASCFSQAQSTITTRTCCLGP